MAEQSGLPEPTPSDPHPWYGPCDALGDGGTCSECGAPFNCPKCGAHDFGLNAPRCPHCGFDDGGSGDGAPEDVRQCVMCSNQIRRGVMGIWVGVNSETAECWANPGLGHLPAGVEQEGAVYVTAPPIDELRAFAIAAISWSFDVPDRHLSESEERLGSAITPRVLAWLEGVAGDWDTTTRGK